MGERADVIARACHAWDDLIDRDMTGEGTPYLGDFIDTALRRWEDERSYAVRAEVVKAGQDANEVVGRDVWSAVTTAALEGFRGDA